MAGRIPQSFINDLIERVDIVALIDSRVSLTRAGKEYKARCPFHEEKTPSFHVMPDKQFYHCFGCGANGTAITFLMEYDRLDFVEAVEALADFVGVEVPRESQGPAPRRIDTNLYTLMDAAAKRYQQELRQAAPAIDYLKSRGLSGEIARDFRIGFAPRAWDTLLVAHRGEGAALKEAGLVKSNDAGRTYDLFRGRIMFPIRDSRGRVIAFGGRTLPGDDAAKYMNSPETPLFKKSQELYGLYEARRAAARLDRALIVEGYMDVVALAQFGLRYAVATLGTACGQSHFEKLFRYTSEVICCFDGDRAGYAAARKALLAALPTLKDGRQLRFLFLPEGEDPDTLVRKEGQEAFEARLDQAEPALSYLFREFAADIDLQSLEGRARLDSLLRPHVDQLPQGVLRTLALKRLAELVGLPEQDGTRAFAAAPGQTATQSGSRDVSAGRIGSPSSENRAESRPAPPERSGHAGLNLRRRMLSLLLAELDAIFERLTEKQREIIKIRVEDPLARIVSYKEQRPDASADEIVGSFAGEADADTLQAARVARPELAGDAVVAEFLEAVERLARLAEREEKRKLIAKMNETSDSEEFLRHWSLNKNGDP
ncbi:MAG: DNA primase [Pseudomonadota bacterium]